LSSPVGLVETPLMNKLSLFLVNDL